MTDTITDVIAAILAALITITVLVTANHAVTRPAAGQAMPVPMAVCTAEDGSADGQNFPCWWDASTQGNRQGESFVLFVAA